MRKIISLIISLMLVCLAAGCAATSGDQAGGAQEASDASVTGSGYEYTAHVDQDSHTCSVEYLGASVDVNEGEFVSDDMDGEYFVLKMTYTNELTLVSHDSDVDDPDNQDSMHRSFVIQAVQDDQTIEPRDEIEAETFEERNVYEDLDAGQSIECEYWFPVDASEPVTIQILNPDGEDTVMAELTFSPDEQDDF